MRILVFHMNQIGDLLFSLPILYNLRYFFKDAYICSLVKKETLKDILELTENLVDDIIFTPSFRSFNLAKLKRLKFDLAIHISQSIEATIISCILKIPKRVGFLSAPLSRLYNVRVKFEPPPSILNNLNLISAINVDCKKREYLGLILPKNNSFILSSLSKPFIIITPGTSKRRREKLWGAHKMAEVIDYIIGNLTYSIVLVASKEDKKICKEILKYSKYKDKIFDLSGNLDIKDVVDLISSSDFVIGVDNGIMHVATSLGKPTLWLFGETDPNKVLPKELIYKENNFIIKSESMKELSSKEVIESLKKCVGSIS